MRKFGFYSRLAAQGIRKSGRYYLPYLLTCIGCVAMCYTMLFLMLNDGINHMPGSKSVTMLLMLGLFVIVIFSAILIFYTNRFLMKRREKEIGLYNVLGMGKAHIARIIFWETVYTVLISVFGGVVVGVLFSKLAQLFLFRLVGAEVPFGFEVSIAGIILTILAFCGIHFLCMLNNFRRIIISRPVELLRGGNVADKEPKTRWVLVVVGIITLATGYYISITVKDPLSALLFFFIAVILVIIGTYCLFSAGCIAALKALRRNKNYYYQTRHFTAVSGMLHRMNRNAAGLASICILSCMVLVTLSTTVCLYAGVDSTVRDNYPHEVNVEINSISEECMERVVSAVSTFDISGLEYVRYYERSVAGWTVVLPGDMLELGTRGELVDLKGDEIGLPKLYIGFETPDGKLPSGFAEKLYDAFGDEKHGYNHYYRSSALAGMRSSAAGFLFIGMYLGALFLAATALIIYYKQISEGYEDAESYKIMQQVGMTPEEVRRSIRGQVVTVFFLPLAIAAVHVAGAFNMIVKLLGLFAMYNNLLFVLCTAATLLVFALIYAVVYALTARSYYRIVRM